MLVGDLSETAQVALAEGADALMALRLRVGRGIKPMLASPADSLDAALEELGGQVSVEYKLDGARIQLHRDGGDVRCSPAACARSPGRCRSWSSWTRPT